MNRLPVTKTPKVYVGGAFIRSESGRVRALTDAAGGFVANIPQCTRKDLRNAVEAAAKAVPGWARRTPYNRGQILYRLAEMLEGRAAEMADAIAAGAHAAGAGAASAAMRAKNTRRRIAAKAAPAPGSAGRQALAAARREVAAAVDRLLYFAGWADKFEQVLGNTNPVAGPFFNFTVCEPMGVVGVLAGDEAPLLGLVSQFAPVIVGGNTVVAHASEARPLPAILLGEILAVSDLPAGVVNLLTGSRRELLPTFATHAHLRALDAVVASPDEKKQLALGAAESVKRLKLRDAALFAAPAGRTATARAPRTGWFADEHESVYAIRDFVEFKTVWHPVGA